MMANDDEPVKEQRASDGEKVVSSGTPVERFHDALSDINSLDQGKPIDGDKAVPIDKDKLMTGHEASPVNYGKSVCEDKAAPADEVSLADKGIRMSEHKSVPVDEDKPIVEHKSALLEEDRPMGEQATAVDKCKPMGTEEEILLEHETRQIQTNAKVNNTNVEVKSTEQIQQESTRTVALDDNNSIQKFDAEPSKDEKREARRIPDCESKLNPESEQLTNGKAETKEVLDANTSFKHETVLSDEETTNSISHLESFEPPVDTKREPSDVTGNKSGITNGASQMECSEIVQSSVDASAQHSETAEEKKKLVHDTDFKSTEQNEPVTDKKDKTNTLFLDETDEGSESGTEEEQTAFMEELARFFKARNMEFRPPKFYGEGLNCLKLWRAVMKLGGYDKVTSCKLWRQVGETFRPPKTCTTVSWTFRGFYEKALLDFERSKIQGGEIVLSTASTLEPTSADNQAPGEGRARRDAAARAMQGWHSQRVLDNGEISNPIVKDKSSASLQKREKQVKNLDGSGLLKRKKPSDVENDVKTPRTKSAKSSLDVEVVDIGTPAEWVKINVQKLKDCYEIYVLVPGLLREEIRVQSDPAGRVVVSGEPANPDNSWGVTPFKKVVSLPSRINPHQTSAVVTLHGQLYIKVPFESSA